MMFYCLTYGSNYVQGITVSLFLYLLGVMWLLVSVLCIGMHVKCICMTASNTCRTESNVWIICLFWYNVQSLVCWSVNMNPTMEVSECKIRGQYTWKELKGTGRTRFRKIKDKNLMILPLSCALSFLKFVFRFLHFAPLAVAFFFGYSTSAQNHCMCACLWVGTLWL